MNWVFLSKNGSDEYINMFAAGCGVEATALESWQYESNTHPLVLRGIMKHKIIKRCWQDQRRFLYMDTGYFGNAAGPKNPQGWKIWHRIVPDDLQHHDIIPRPADRWQRHGLRVRNRQNGSRIMIAAPDDKPCIFYGIDREAWLRDTIDALRQHTDRDIFVRERDPNRRRRVSNDLVSALDDVWAVVTFNSLAATESVMNGVPAFVLAPTNAAHPVANQDLARIENPFWPDPDLVQLWCQHLAYGQFHNDELKDGTARSILEAEWPQRIT